MLALRSGEPRYLATGLLAYCATHQGVTDWRDDLVAFAPYFHVARALSVDVATLFDDAADYAAPDMAQTMQTFGRRTDVTLGAFGWRQIDTPDGPTFEMLSLRGAPTGAVVGERSWNEVNEAQARALLEWVRRQREQHPGDG
jgi:hypothetical protein